jgi:hypothetical protein
MNTHEQDFPAGSVVWTRTPFYGGAEIRCRVLDTKPGRVLVKLPGADGGVAWVPAEGCLISQRPPMTVVEAQEA